MIECYEIARTIIKLHLSSKHLGVNGKQISFLVGVTEETLVII